MKDYNLAAIHDRIDEEHFEVHLHEQAIKALQERVNQLEATVRELREVVFHERTDRPREKGGRPWPDTLRKTRAS
jgi:hypothetical protein